jgi:hypothetical protein
VPQRNDDGPAPPVKTLRKRLSGVYRADGFSGPTRRYVLLVAMLVGLASLPTLAAITAGSRELDDGPTGALDTPFLPPASSGPVPPFRPPASIQPDVAAPVPGRAHRQKSKSDHARYARSTPPPRRHPARNSRPSPVAHHEESGSRSRTARPAHHHRPDRARPKKCERTTQQFARSVARDRSRDRSETPRSARVAERPYNLRRARTADRTHNSRRLRAEFRPDDAHGVNRGRHRADRHHHHADHTRANRHNAGAARHHPEHSGHR